MGNDAIDQCPSIDAFVNQYSSTLTAKTVNGNAEISCCSSSDTEKNNGRSSSKESSSDISTSADINNSCPFSDSRSHSPDKGGNDLGGVPRSTTASTFLASSASSSPSSSPTSFPASPEPALSATSSPSPSPSPSSGNDDTHRSREGGGPLPTLAAALLQPFGWLRREVWLDSHEAAAETARRQLQQLQQQQLQKKKESEKEKEEQNKQEKHEEKEEKQDKDKMVTKTKKQEFLPAPRPNPTVQANGDAWEFEQRYFLGAKIGQGSFGKVFECQASGENSSDSSKALCVKVVPLRGRHSTRLVKVDEAEKKELLQRCLRLDHPNVVKHLEFIQTHDALYTVMTRSDGLDLVDYVKKCNDQLTIPTIRSFARQILSAVAAVHAGGLMHRDIKPENFRLTNAGTETLQLLDFGFAKPISEIVGTGSSAAMAHSITGTLLYAAPEVFDGFYNEKCDVWSCGVVLFQLFAGHPPYQTSDVVILRSLHRDPLLQGEGLFRRQKEGEIPKPVRHLLSGLLSYDVSNRLTSREASEHIWLEARGSSSSIGAGDFEEEDEDQEDDMTTCWSTLKRDSSTILEGMETSPMKRSFFVWDLAANGADEN